MVSGHNSEIVWTIFKLRGRGVSVLSFRNNLHLIFLFNVSWSSFNVFKNAS